MKVFEKLGDKDQHLLQLAQGKLEQMYDRQIKELAMKKKVFWINFFCAGQPALQFEQQEAALLEDLLQLADSIIQKYNLPKKILSIGISINPKGSKDQFPHIDYEGITSTVFIPLTPVVTQNTISYFEPELTDEEKKRIALGLSAEEIFALLTEFECNMAGQMKEIKAGFKPFSLVYLPAATIHRAVGNASGYDRKMLLIMLTDDPNYLLDEGDAEQGI